MKAGNAPVAVSTSPSVYMTWCPPVDLSDLLELRAQVRKARRAWELPPPAAEHQAGDSAASADGAEGAAETPPAQDGDVEGGTDRQLRSTSGGSSAA